MMMRWTLLKEPVTRPLNVENLLEHVNEHVVITGYYVTHKITRTKNGQEMSFGTFLDAEGYFFDTVHFPEILKNFRFSGKGCYRIEGKVVEEFGFPSIEVSYMEKLGILERN